MEKPGMLETVLRLIAIPFGLGAMSELKRSPWTTATALLALTLVGVNSFTYASQSDLGDLRDQVADLGSTLRAVRSGQIVGDIMQAREKACHAAVTDQREYFQAQLNRALEDYYGLWKRQFQLPSCSEI